MSDLRPVGVPVNFDGVDRCFLFTFARIDELQYRHPGVNIFRQVDMSKEDTLDGLIHLIDIVDVLCDGMVPKAEIPKVLKKNVLTGDGNLSEVRLAISLALVESMPIQTDDESEDGTPGTGLFEIPKFIILCMSKFGLSESQAWSMTPRKFSLYNDAYLTINGLKKKEEHMSLLDLP